MGTLDAWDDFSGNVDLVAILTSLAAEGGRASALLFLHIPVELSPSPRGLPTSSHLAAGNGGEYRKSYHGFASSTAYVIDSPQSLMVVPMQVSGPLHRGVGDIIPFFFC